MPEIRSQGMEELEGQSGGTEQGPSLDPAGPKHLEFGGRPQGNSYFIQMDVYCILLFSGISY